MQKGEHGFVIAVGSIFTITVLALFVYELMAGSWFMSVVFFLTLIAEAFTLWMTIEDWRVCG
ncbi:hypothetical protein A2Z56_04545 [Candidatus Kaiserbacteria bacterium RIFCSPHIGHO2_12_45_16]|nr:MAG: hypothetical protein A2Z56_04545 [Candidatus Kaiserbacteria bacterium RIFCSPHIGHO2_12_45_16]